MSLLMMNKKLIAFNIAFLMVCLIFSGFWMKRAFDYQDDLIRINQENFELNQTIENYKIFCGESR